MLFMSKGDVPVGQMVSFAYDLTGNSLSLLLHYGFVLPGNPMDFVQLELAAPHLIKEKLGDHAAG
jgi:hypothetical protein